MPRHDFRSPRLFVDAAIGPAARIALDKAQTNYLVNVLRLKPGATILIFNGRDGEWKAQIEAEGRRAVTLVASTCARPQPPQTDLHYLFAPLKHARLDYMVQKAVELGASVLQPVITQHTVAERVNLARMRANVIEAAEQCGILALPTVQEPLSFAKMIAEWDPGRRLVFCDEAAEVADPIAALTGAAAAKNPPMAVLIGPEGGFAEHERAALLRLPNSVTLSLGPRILRADTAAVAALTLAQAVLGNWKD